jgi:hypothetical protein
MKDGFMQKLCSIKKEGDEVVVVDHRRDDLVIKPSCGMDAMSVHAYLRCSLKSGGGERAAEKMIESIASGGLPISEMNPSEQEYVLPRKERTRKIDHA